MPQIGSIASWAGAAAGTAAPAGANARVFLARRRPRDVDTWDDYAAVRAVLAPG